MNKIQLLVAASTLGIASLASAGVPVIKVSVVEGAHSASFSEKKESALAVDNAASKAGSGSFNAVSGDYLAGKISNNLSVIKSSYRQTVASAPSLPMPETGILALLVLGFVAIQSVGRKNRAGAIRLQ